MGYPTNEAGSQTGEGLVQNLRHREGLIEFLHPIGLNAPRDDRIVKEVRMTGFPHFGVVVPDVKAAERRINGPGVPILKGLGDAEIEPGSDVAKMWGWIRYMPSRQLLGPERCLRTFFLRLIPMGILSLLRVSDQPTGELYVNSVAKVHAIYRLSC